jgi:hypothetical protein
MKISIFKTSRYKQSLTKKKKKKQTDPFFIYWFPLQFGGGAGTPDSVSRDPQGQVPKNSLLNQSPLSRVGSYILQNQEPSTVEKSDKADSYVLQNQNQNF